MKIERTGPACERVVSHGLVPGFGVYDAWIPSPDRSGVVTHANGSACRVDDVVTLLDEVLS